MPFDFTTQVDGKDVKITLPDDAVFNAVRETHLPKDAVAKDLDKRAQAIVKNQGLRKPEELLDDEAFVAQVLEKHGKKTGTDDEAASRQLKDALARQRQEFEAKELNPLKQSLTAQTDRERKLLIRDLERQILQAAAPYVREGLLKSPGKGRPAPIVTLLEDAFAYDEDSNEFFVADGDNFVISGSGVSTYKTVEEFVQEWVADKANTDWVRPGQAGSDARGGASSTRVAGDVVLSQEEASNARVYAEALKRVGGDHSKIRVATR